MLHQAALIYILLITKIRLSSDISPLHVIFQSYIYLLIVCGGTCLCHIVYMMIRDYLSRFGVFPSNVWGP